MHLLDSDTLTFLAEDHPRVVQRLREVPGGEAATTIISRIELLRGRFEFILKAASTSEFLRAQQLLHQTERLFTSLRVILLDNAALAHFERLQATKGLKKIGRADLLIAGIALAHGATLVTRNLRHFRRIPGLGVVNWVD